MIAARGSVTIPDMIRGGMNNAGISKVTGLPCAYIAEMRERLNAGELAPVVDTWKAPRISQEWRRVRTARALARTAYRHAHSAARVARRNYGGASYTRDLVTLRDSHAYARRQLAKLREERAFLARYNVDVPRGMLAGDEGCVPANQGWRDAECLAVVDGLALIAYGMPGGRVFYWQLPAAFEWADLVTDGPHTAGVRNVSADKPAKRWAHVVAAYNAACGQ